MIHLFIQYFSTRRMIFILGEGVLIYCAITLASFLLLGMDMDTAYLLKMIWPKVLLVALVTQLILYFNDLYEFKNSDNLIDLGIRLIQSIRCELNPRFFGTRGPNNSWTSSSSNPIALPNRGTMTRSNSRLTN